MARRALPVPDPVCDAQGDVAMFTGEIGADVAKNPTGLDGCVLCQTSTTHCWPIARVAERVAAEGPRTASVDGTVFTVVRTVPSSWATLPSVVGLHPGCVPGLLDAQAWSHHGDAPAGDVPADGAPTTGRGNGSARRQGAYGRRRNG